MPIHLSVQGLVLYQDAEGPVSSLCNDHRCRSFIAILALLQDSYRHNGRNLNLWQYVFSNANLSLRSPVIDVWRPRKGRRMLTRSAPKYTIIRASHRGPGVGWAWYRAGKKYCRTSAFVFTRASSIKYFYIYLYIFVYYLFDLCHHFVIT